MAVVDVVDTLSSLMRRSNKLEHIEPSDIVNILALQHGVDALVSGVLNCACKRALWACFGSHCASLRKVYSHRGTVNH